MSLIGRQRKASQTEQAGDYYWKNPQIIRLLLLSAVEARDMLLLELDKGKLSRDELAYAIELVQAMRLLPVAIYAVA
jgi:hypothetical protein